MIVLTDEFTKKPIEALAVGDEVMTLEGRSRVYGVAHDRMLCVRLTGTGIDQVQPENHEVLTVAGWRSYGALVADSLDYGDDGEVVRAFVKCAGRVPFPTIEHLRAISPWIRGTFTAEVASADYRRAEQSYRHPYALALISLRHGRVFWSIVRLSR